MWIIAFGIGNSWAAGSCVPARQFVEADVSAQIYMRIHPSGRYALASTDSSGVLYDLSVNPAKVIWTPTQNEVYPVEGNWKLLASPLHSDGMRYYSFQKILDAEKNGNPAEVESEFNDADHNQWYHSAAELPDSKGNKLHFRTVLYDALKYRDYRVDFSNGKASNVQLGPIRDLCAHIDAKQKKVTTLDHEKRKAHEAELKKILRERNKLADELMVMVEASAYSDSRVFGRRIEELSTVLYRSEQRMADLLNKLGQIGNHSGEISEPIVSKDGRYVAVDVNGQQKILKIEADRCREVYDFGFNTGKVSFAYPDSSRTVKVVFNSQETGRASILDIKTQKVQTISDPDDLVKAYPGFTRDGRVIYASCGPSTCGFHIVDPNQLDGGSGKCITQEQVTQVNSSSPAARPRGRK